MSKLRLNYYLFFSADRSKKYRRQWSSDFTGVASETLRLRGRKRKNQGPGRIKLSF